MIGEVSIFLPFSQRFETLPVRGEANVRVRLQKSEGLIFRDRQGPSVTIDAGTLGEDDRRSLEQMVHEARFFDLPARIPSFRGARDTTCQITIEDRGREHSVTVCDPVQGPALRRLIARLHELGTPTESDDRKCEV